MSLRVPAPTPAHNSMPLLPGDPSSSFSLPHALSNGMEAQMSPSRPSEALHLDTEKTEAVYQQTQRVSERKRKSSAPQKSLPKNSASASVEFAVPPPFGPSSSQEFCLYEGCSNIKRSSPRGRKKISPSRL